MENAGNRLTFGRWDVSGGKLIAAKVGSRGSTASVPPSEGGTGGGTGVGNGQRAAAFKLRRFGREEW